MRQFNVHQQQQHRHSLNKCIFSALNKLTLELLKNSVVCTWVIVVVLLDVTCASWDWRRWTGRWKWPSWLDEEANTSRWSTSLLKPSDIVSHRWTCISRPPSFPGRSCSLLCGRLYSGQWRQRTRLADEAEWEAVAAGKNVWQFLPYGTCAGNHGLSQRWEEMRNHKSWERGEELEAQVGEMRFDLLRSFDGGNYLWKQISTVENIPHNRVFLKDWWWEDRFRLQSPSRLPWIWDLQAERNDYRNNCFGGRRGTLWNEINRPWQKIFSAIKEACRATCAVSVRLL